MKQRLAMLKYYKPSIVLVGLTIIATLFAHPHIVVPIILIIAATLMAYQNYNTLKNKAQEQVEPEVE